MSTTALLVKILIIGFQVILWMLLSVSLANADLVGSWLNSDGNALVQAGGLAGAAYVLGIVADKSAKWVVEDSSLAYLFHFNPAVMPDDEPNEDWPANMKIRAALQRMLRPDASAVNSERPTANAKPSAYLEQYAAVVESTKDFMSDLLYGRSKVRILRASIFTLPLLVLTGASVWARAEAKIWLAILIVVVGLFLSIVVARYFIWLYCYNRWLYRYRLDYFYRAATPSAPVDRG